VTTDSIQEALKKSGAPDYMVLIITEVTSAKDAIRAMQSELSSRALDLKHREQNLEDREDAFVKAAKDMTEFANRIYGPTSELTQIHSKLAAMEAAATNRDSRYASQYSEISSNQTRLKDWTEQRFRELDDRVKDAENAIADLQKKSA
jgi:uncharacterized protein (DUF3084 family)